MNTVDIENPVFIGGSGSSGTTLLRVILDRHPDIFCGHELSVFNKKEFLTNYPKIRSRFGYYLKNGLSTDGYFKYYSIFEHMKEYDLSDALLRKWIEESDDVRSFFEKLITHSLVKNKKTIFAEKTPSNTYTFLELASLFPKARFIHIHRDGRDVICSLKKRGFNWFQASSLWLYNTIHGIEGSALENFHQLSYEDLVSNPAEEIKKLCGFLGVKFYSEMLTPKQNVRNKQSGLSTWNSNPVHEIKDSAVGKYRDLLSKEGYAVFLNTVLTEKVSAELNSGIATVPDLMKYLGYNLEEMNNDLPYTAIRFEISDRVMKVLKSLKHLEAPEKALTKLKY